ncbi:hypothetical protein ACIBEA_30895 [Streptomyces sp. NPDC051555]|uniref:hypothetical protein n=1 Tax=Streptomyces sp. NPDC051555 TaxID=3365657 RepID=UPI0037B70F64
MESRTDASVVDPHLSGTEKFRLTRHEAATPPVTDRAGAALSAERSPSLKPVLDQLVRESDGGPRGVIERIDRATGEVVAPAAASPSPSSSKAASPADPPPFRWSATSWRPSPRTPPDLNRVAPFFASPPSALHRKGT